MKKLQNLSIKNSVVKKAILTPLLVILTGCGVSRIDPAQYPLKEVEINTPNHTLLSLHKSVSPQKSIIIHLEGDGLAYITKSRPSADPTPATSVMLNMVASNAPYNSVYLARPCQFIMSASCTRKDWTTERYATRHIESMSNAISKIKNMYQAEEIHLIGHSGGGTMATLIAHYRMQNGLDDVKSIRTLAGNLNIEGFNKHHKVTAMPNVTDPASIASSIGHIPQIHYSGGQDKIVPEALAYKYMIHSGKTGCLQFKTLQNVTHNKGWQAYTAEIYGQQPSCKPLNK